MQEQIDALAEALKKEANLETKPVGGQELL